MIKKILFLCFVVAFIFPATVGVSMAQDDVAVDEKALKDDAEKAIKAQKEAAKKTHEMMQDLAKDLDTQEQKHFYMTYSNYNLIGTVEVVKRDVENAAKACGETNPDMKASIDKRFKKWSDAISPVIQEAKANVNNMVLAQDYAPKSDVKKVFKSVDDTRALTDKLMEKVPVTTKDACQFLLDNMDKTQPKMLQLLRQTLVSFPQAFPDSGADAKSE